jgi:hypothetical protein
MHNTSPNLAWQCDLVDLPGEVGKVKVDTVQSTTVTRRLFKCLEELLVEAVQTEVYCLYTRVLYTIYNGHPCISP